MTVRIALIDKNKGYYKEVEGRDVSFSGFNDYHFILHRSPDEKTPEWRVSEKTTGFCFASGKTPNVAMKVAKKRLLGLAKIQLDKGIRKAKIKFRNLQEAFKCSKKS